MDDGLRNAIRKYYRTSKEYRDSKNEQIKQATKLFYDAVENYLEEIGIPRKNWSFKAIHRLYKRLEPSLLSKEEGELIKIFERIEKIITHPRFRFSLLELKLAKK